MSYLAYCRHAPQVFGVVSGTARAALLPDIRGNANAVIIDGTEGPPTQQPHGKQNETSGVTSQQSKSRAKLAAAFWLSRADAVVICAVRTTRPPTILVKEGSTRASNFFPLLLHLQPQGAGMSIGSPEEALYTNPEAFAKHYPVLRRRFGFQTAGQTMGLASDLSVPITAKWGYWARHCGFPIYPSIYLRSVLSLSLSLRSFSSCFLTVLIFLHSDRNMRFRYPPNEGYQELLSLTADKDTFICRFYDLNVFLKLQP